MGVCQSSMLHLHGLQRCEPPHSLVARGCDPGPYAFEGRASDPSESPLQRADHSISQSTATGGDLRTAVEPERPATSGAASSPCAVSDMSQLDLLGDSAAINDSPPLLASAFDFINDTPAMLVPALKPAPSIAEGVAKQVMDVQEKVKRPTQEQRVLYLQNELDHLYAQPGPFAALNASTMNTETVLTATPLVCKIAFPCLSMKSTLWSGDNDRWASQISCSETIEGAETGILTGEEVLKFLVEDLIAGLSSGGAHAVKLPPGLGTVAQKSTPIN